MRFGNRAPIAEFARLPEPLPGLAIELPAQSSFAECRLGRGASESPRSSPSSSRGYATSTGRSASNSPARRRWPCAKPTFRRLLYSCIYIFAKGLAAVLRSDTGGLQALSGVSSGRRWAGRRRRVSEEFLFQAHGRQVALRMAGPTLQTGSASVLRSLATLRLATMCSRRHSVPRRMVVQARR